MSLGADAHWWDIEEDLTMLHKNTWFYVIADLRQDQENADASMSYGIMTLRADVHL